MIGVPREVAGEVLLPRVRQDGAGALLDLGAARSAEKVYAVCTPGGGRRREGVVGWLHRPPEGVSAVPVPALACGGIPDTGGQRPVGSGADEDGQLVHTLRHGRGRGVQRPTMRLTQGLPAP